MLSKERAMSKKQKRIFWPVLVMVALGLGALAFASSRNARRATLAPPLASQDPRAATNAKPDDYVRMSRLPSQLRWSLKALGDRIQKPGKERLTLAGTLQDANAVPAPV